MESGHSLSSVRLRECAAWTNLRAEGVGIARIFLSYAREDVARAGRIAEALEGAGHAVWWDPQITAGSRFSAEIDRELRQAELVVVLWSHSSIVSAWVQDEAAVGRDSGRLVPVLIDDVQPPLGFRQYQAVRLTGFKGSSRSVRRLLDAVAARGTAATDDHAIEPRRERFAFVFGWKSLAAAAGLAALLFGALLFLRHPAGGASPTVAVAAAHGDDSPRSLELAHSIAVDLGRYRAGPLGSLIVLSAGDAKAADADYRVEVGVSGSGADTRADVRLLSPRQPGPLWTSTLENRTGRMVDIRQQAAAQLGDVLTCMVEVQARRQPPSPEILGLFLNGCAIDSADESALSIFRQITAKAPHFAPGWASLALIESWLVSDATESDRPALIAAAQAHLKRAKELDPLLAEVFAADANIHASDGTKPGRALQILDRGLALRPESGLLRSFRSRVLLEVGRMNEAVAEGEKAVQLNPLSPGTRRDYISALAYAGETGEAFRELEKAEAIWPGSTGLRSVRFSLDLRFGDPRNALRMLEGWASSDLAGVPTDQAWKAFLEARIDPSAANTNKALAAFRARYRRDHADIPGYLQALGTFGQVDEAFQAVAPAETIDSLKAASDILFRPHMRSIRADPRFVALADHLGLLTLWERSRVWPDFCSDPDLPYDCRAEAAKLRQRGAASSDKMSSMGRKWKAALGGNLPSARPGEALEISRALGGQL